MKNLNDFDLVVLFKQGDNRAFEEILLRYQSHVYTYILSMVRNIDSANDIFQEVSLRMFKKLKDYKDENKLKNWIFAIAKNMTMDYFRKKKKEFLPIETLEDPSFLNFISDSSPQQLELLVTNSEIELLKTAVNSLSREERELIHLKEYLSFKDIAAIQNKPLGTLLSKFNRALKKIKIFIEKQEKEVDCNEYMR
ncbi:MAG: sigma-70 family RNA polymerase sigma factor [Elusimicrobiota bacterium]|nr:sigma-70 family RNA polymerase sigma factor [Elusimicrobiota bacterium]